MDATEAHVLDQVREQMARAIGWGTVDLRLESVTGEVDAVLDVPTPAGWVRLLVEVKKHLTPASSQAAAEEVRRYAATTGVDGTIVVSPWLSEASRQALTSAGVSWADATGNMRLRLDEPPLLVMARGADRNPRPKTRELYEGFLRLHILPSLGPLPLGRLTTAGIRRWHADLLADGPAPRRRRSATSSCARSWAPPWRTASSPPTRARSRGLAWSRRTSGSWRPSGRSTSSPRR